MAQRLYYPLATPTATILPTASLIPTYIRASQPPPELPVSAILAAILAVILAVILPAILAVMPPRPTSLSLRQVFKSADDFKVAVRAIAVSQHWEASVHRSDLKRVIMKCRSKKNCSLEIRCSYGDKI